MVVKKDGGEKLENLVFEIFVFFTPYIYRAQILPAAGVPKTQLRTQICCLFFLRPQKIPPGNSALGLDSLRGERGVLSIFGNTNQMLTFSNHGSCLNHTSR